MFRCRSWKLASAALILLGFAILACAQTHYCPTDGSGSDEYCDYWRCIAGDPDSGLVFAVGDRQFRNRSGITIHALSQDHGTTFTIINPRDLYPQDYLAFSCANAVFQSEAELKIGRAHV